MKAIIPVLILLLTFSLAFADVRLVGLSLAYLPGELGAGYPRLAEVLAIVSSFVFLLNRNKNNLTNPLIMSGTRMFFLCSLIMTLFAMFKPTFFIYLRSSCLIPMLLFVSTIKLRVDEKSLVRLMRIIYFVISFSAIFVVINPFIDLDVQKFYIYSEDSEVQRYVGFGSSLPYQACFNLCAIPLYFFLKKKECSNKWLLLLLSSLSLNIMAIILTGARTAYIILLILLFYYRGSWIHLFSRKSLIIVIIVAVISIYNMQDSLLNILNNRHFTDLSSRDVVWIIGLKLILLHPILGIQNFFVEGKELGHVVAHVQNGFFEMAFWGGLFALFFYLTAFLNYYRAIRKNRYLRGGFTGILLIFLLFMLSEILIYSIQDYYLILLILGLFLANRQTNLYNK